MPDRSLRLPPLLLRERRPSPTPPQESGRDAADGRGQEAPSSDPSTPSDPSGPSDRPSEDNPFAPPPEGTPDRPWQPRRPVNGQGGSEEDNRPGQSGQPGQSPWGNQWSDRQPGRSSGGGFGDRPGAPQGQNGPEGPTGGPGAGMRWDPTDPSQRRARFALLSGMWAFFFALFSWPYVALLLGALGLYWGGSALRAKPRTPDPDAPAPDPNANARPQTTAAVSGLVTASLALAMVAATFTAQFVYSDYYSCTNDALTNTAKQSCNDLLPKELRGLLGTR
ncbi:hypothetical protein AB5J56_18005 [Streptomyces sp. R21]|uniref:Integral membrane protein n=1 Tax=Streptomyces sp. R21 TaxID=3238627 RepID=A0AB39P9I7_9ACTN